MIIKINKIVQSQNIKLYKINYKNNLNDINKEYINSNSFNLLDVLIVLMKMYSKLKPNLKTKNVKII